jgi:hypothetical protein
LLNLVEWWTSLVDWQIFFIDWAQQEILPPRNRYFILLSWGGISRNLDLEWFALDWLTVVPRTGMVLLERGGDPAGAMTERYLLQPIGHVQNLIVPHFVVQLRLLLQDVGLGLCLHELLWWLIRWLTNLKLVLLDQVIGA